MCGLKRVFCIIEKTNSLASKQMTNEIIIQYVHKKRESSGFCEFEKCGNGKSKMSWFSCDKLKVSVMLLRNTKS